MAAFFMMAWIIISIAMIIAFLAEAIVVGPQLKRDREVIARDLALSEAYLESVKEVFVLLERMAPGAMVQREAVMTAILQRFPAETSMDIPKWVASAIEKEKKRRL